MPLHRRLPKRGFISHKHTDEVRLCDLAQVKSGTVDLASLKSLGLVGIHAEQAKVVLKGELKSKVAVIGVRVSAGAKAAIEAAGGSVSDFVPEVRGRLKKKVKDPA